jgi:sugar phosphate isomerase/epimerase
MLIGICGNSSSLAATIGASGADYIEESVQTFLAPEGDENEFRARAAHASAGIPVTAANLFLPATLRCVGEAVDRERILRWADSACRRARLANIDVIVFGSGGARKLIDGYPTERAFAQFVELLRAIGPIAERHGVAVVVEPLNRGECNFINTLAEGAEIVRAVRHPSIQLLADIYHMMRNDETPEDLAAHAAEVRHAHIAERETRSSPGTKGDDFRPFFAALRRGGYDRRISLECKFADLASELPRAVREVRRQLSEAGYA